MTQTILLEAIATIEAEAEKLEAKAARHRAVVASLRTLYEGGRDDASLGLPRSAITVPLDAINKSLIQKIEIAPRPRGRAVVLLDGAEVFCGDRDEAKARARAYATGAGFPEAPVLNEHADDMPVPTAPERAAAPRRGRPPGNRRRTAGNAERVLAIATTLGREFKAGDIMRQITINRAVLVRALKALVERGQLKRTGNTSQARYTVTVPGRPETPPAPASTSTSAPATTNGAPMLATIPLSVLRVLATGASHDVKDILKGLRGVAPGLTPEDLAPVLIDLVHQGQIERISVGRDSRYRRRARPTR